MRWFFYNVANPFIAIFLAVFIGVGFGLSLFTSATIELWSLSFGVCFLICATFFAIRKPNFSLGIDLEVSRFSRMDRWLGYVPYLIFLPALAIVFSDTHFQMVFDGDIHTSYINEILVGTTPPENPFLPGYPPNYYWLYHALIATFANMTNLAPPLISSLLNVMALICIFAWTKQIIRALGYGDKHPLLVNLMAIFVVFGLNIFGIIHAADDILSGGVGTNISRDMILMGDSRLRSLWFKFLAFNSFPLTLVYYLMGIFASIQLMKGYIRSSFLALMLIAIAGGVEFNLGTGLFTVAVLPAAMIGAYVVYELLTLRPLRFEPLVARLSVGYRAIREHIAKTDLLWLGIQGIVTAFLMGKYYVGATASYQITGSFSLTSQRNLQSLVSTYYPILPFFVVALIYALKSRNRVMLFTGLAAVLGCGISYVAVLRGNNQYKFIHLSSFLICLTIIPVIHILIYRVQNPTYRRLGKGVAGVLLVLTLLNVSYAGATRIKEAIDLNAGLVNTHQITYDGRYLVSGIEPYQDVYEWLRESTPARTVIVMPVAHSSRLAMISARLPYAGGDRYIFVKRVPEYPVRVNQIETFFAPETSLDERRQIIAEFLQFDPARPMVLLIPHDMMIPSDQLTALDLQLLFQGEKGDAFGLRFDG